MGDLQGRRGPPEFNENFIEFLPLHGELLEGKLGANHKGAFAPNKKGGRKIKRGNFQEVVGKKHSQERQVVGQGLPQQQQKRGRGEEI